MRRYFFMFFVCMFPFFAAIGHDIYLFINDAENGFQLSAAGYIWTQYNPESYKAFVGKASPELMGFVNGFLHMKFVVLMFMLGLLLPALMAAEYFLLRLLFGRMGGGRSKAMGSTSRIDNLMGRKSAVMQYKRK